MIVPMPPTMVVVTMLMVHVIERAPSGVTTLRRRASSAPTMPIRNDESTHTQSLVRKVDTPISWAVSSSSRSARRLRPRRVRSTTKITTVEMTASARA